MFKAATFKDDGMIRVDRVSKCILECLINELDRFLKEYSNLIYKRERFGRGIIDVEFDIKDVYHKHTVIKYLVCVNIMRQDRMIVRDYSIYFIYGIGSR